MQRSGQSVRHSTDLAVVVVSSFIRSGGPGLGHIVVLILHIGTGQTSPAHFPLPGLSTAQFL